MRTDEKINEYKVRNEEASAFGGNVEDDDGDFTGGGIDFGNMGGVDKVTQQ